MQLTPVSQPGAAAAAAPSPIDALTDALHSEQRLIDELVATMRRQREAVAADDLQTLDDSVFATHRILQTLGEARKRRRSLNRLLGEPEDLGLRELEHALGGRMTAALRVAKDGLQAAARTLSREVAINREVLREAMASSDSYVRILCGGPAEQLYGAPAAQPAPAAPVYGAPKGAPKGAVLLLNRQA